MKPQNECDGKEGCVKGWCVNACKIAPGRFLPGEVEEAAHLLGMSPQDFFEKYVTVDYDHVSEFFLLKATSDAPGRMENWTRRGRCLLLTEDDKCMIHEAKPAECAMAVHPKSENRLDVELSNDESSKRMDEIVQAWNNDEAQAEVMRYFPHPYIPEPDTSYLSMFSLMPRRGE